MKESQRFALDVSITFTASVVNMLLVFVITALLGRYLGAEQLGLYGMTTTLFTITKLIASVGIPSAIVKYVAETKENRTDFSHFVSSGIITVVISGMIIIILFSSLPELLATIFNMPELSGLLRILSLVFPFALLANVLLGVLNGLRKMKKHAISTIFRSVLLIIVTLPLIYYGFGVTGAIIGIIASFGGECMLLFWFTKEYYDITIHAYLATTKKLLSFGSRIVGSGALSMINYQADTLLIGYFLTAADVGFYAVALRFSRFFWLIPQAIQTITYPTTSEYWTKDEKAALQKMIDKSMKYTACILLPIGLGVGFFGKYVILAIFGDAFTPAFLPLKILLVGAIVAGSTTRSVGGSMPAIGRPDLSLKATAVSAVVNILLNVLLIPPYGIVGAAIATTASFFVLMGIMLFLIVTKAHIKVDFKWYAEIGMLTFVCILIHYFLGYINPFFVGGGSLLLFFAMTWSYFFTDEDKTFFKGLLKLLKDFLNSH